MRRRSVSIRRGGATALVAGAALVLGAAPAAADPPRPSDYRSTVDEVEPDAAGVEARVVGGDAFLELTVDEGHDVVVTGYGDEPYLHFLPDGTVERNRRSEATYLNDDRQGAVDLPAEADNEAEPEWEEVADGGTYSWHDHRIHWMGGGTPPGAEPGQVVQEWTVGLTVDGTPTEVRGELVLAEEISPLPWVALAATAAALVAVVGRRRPAPVAAAAMVVAAAGALAVGWAEYAAAPAGSGVSPVPVAVPLAGLVAAVVGAVRPRGTVGSTATLAAAAAAIGWAVLRAGVLWNPVLPTDLPFALDRGVTALALGLSAAAAGLVVWGGGLTGALQRPGEAGEPTGDHATGTGSTPGPDHDDHDPGPAVAG
jgi:hypothetical protein